jgi:hypothetical protein
MRIVPAPRDFDMWYDFPQNIEDRCGRAFACTGTSFSGLSGRRSAEPLGRPPLLAGLLKVGDKTQEN